MLRLGLFVLLTSMLASGGALSQTADDVLQSLVKPDVPAGREAWSVSRSDIVQEVVDRLIANNALINRRGNTPPGGMTVDTLQDLVQRERVILLCRKRLYDDHLELLQLATPREPSFGNQFYPLEDWILIEDALGGSYYDFLRNKDYPWTGTTGSKFHADQKSAFDLYFHAFNPRLMLWRMSDSASPLDKSDPLKLYSAWTVSVLMNMGNDRLNLPGWYKGTVGGGILVRYIDDKIRVSDRGYDLFTVAIGWEEPINFTVQTKDDPSESGVFKTRRVQGSGSAIYVKGTYTPDGILGLKDDQYVRFGLEGSVAISEKKGYGQGIPTEFYSVRNYITLSGELRHIGIFNFGTALSWHDLHHLTWLTSPPSNIEPTTNHFIPALEAGIAQDELGSLIQYSLSAELNYDVTGGFGFMVVKSSVMLGNTFGFDFRYFKAMSSAQLPSWHYDNYIVVSPIIRINY